MFEWSEDENRLEALHHPFTSNQEDGQAGTSSRPGPSPTTSCTTAWRLAADRSASTEGRREVFDAIGLGKRRLRRSLDT